MFQLCHPWRCLVAQQKLCWLGVWWIQRGPLYRFGATHESPERGFPWYFQCRGQEFNHWSGNQDPICHLAQHCPPPKKERKKEKITRKGRSRNRQKNQYNTVKLKNKIKYIKKKKDLEKTEPKFSCSYLWVMHLDVSLIFFFRHLYNFQIFKNKCRTLLKSEKMLHLKILNFK